MTRRRCTLRPREAINIIVIYDNCYYNTEYCSVIQKKICNQIQDEEEEEEEDDEEDHAFWPLTFSFMGRFF